ncbi:uncharacterized protein LOC135697730 [Ochlerotatus camptorhynchus]|uniref:uncharacterized protein LOC135697730 n=1 Tax=Ochlerotatus camptorhynchus TaxID=644619 RepID=UPI0031DA52A9
MIEVKQSQTAKFLKDTILEILQSYEVSIDQILSVTTDNGANMIAAVKMLQKISAVFGVSPETLLEDEGHQCNEKEIELLDSLASEFDPLLCLTRCASHTLQLAVGDVVKKNDPNIRRITDLVKESRKNKYCLFFELKQASKAPLWSSTRWGGRYKMIESIVQQEKFYTELAQDYKEIEITNDDWKFMKDFIEAFSPVYTLTNDLQMKHVTLSDFYMQWLQAIRSVESHNNNPLCPSLSLALKNRLKKLQENKLFLAAVFLDPRFNFLGSSIFPSADDKESVQSFIVNVWERINKIKKPSTSAEVPMRQSNVQKADEMDDYLTQLFGSSETTSANIASSFQQQLHHLNIENRQPHHYDVWSHWLARKHSHPELFEVAMVVLSGSSSQVSVERAFSALALVLSDLRTGLSEEALQDILMIKLNKEIFEKIIPTMYDWKVELADRSET